MKRRPLIIAAVVTVAALACVVPWWWEVWLWVAYEEKTNRILTHLGGSGEVIYHEKRIEWLPGPMWIGRDQSCHPCNAIQEADYHVGQCSREIDLMWSDRVVKLKDRYGKQVTCTCPTCHPERER